jgi:histidinol-phosphate phosphatase family protein
MSDAAIFLDRDGTIMVDKDYLADPNGVELFPNTVAALTLAQRLGYRLFVISNQSGVARGYMTEAEVQSVNAELEKLLLAEGIELDGLFYCPHHPDISGPCSCRKPGRGMVDMALADHQIDLVRSFVIGDCKSDIDLAFKIGARAVLVTTGYGNEELKLYSDGRKPDHVAVDILEAVTWIAGHAGL